LLPEKIVFVGSLLHFNTNTLFSSFADIILILSVTDLCQKNKQKKYNTSKSVHLNTFQNAAQLSQQQVIYDLI
jgi:hypothetical protein